MKKTSNPINITFEQEALLPLYRERWREILCSTEAADRKSAESWLRTRQQAIGESAPDHVIWAETPAIGVLVEFVLSQLRNGDNRSHRWHSADRHQFADSLGRDETNRYLQRLTDQAYERFLVVVEASVQSDSSEHWETVFELLKRSAGIYLDKSKQSSLIELRRKYPSQYRNGDYQAEERGLFPFAEFLSEVCSVEVSRSLRASIALRKSVGPFWYFGGRYAILTERPSYIAFDERERLHSLTSPVISYREGTCFFAINGVAVPPKVVLEPDVISVNDIKGEPNAEVRRTMIEQFGWDKFLDKAGFVEIGRSEEGRLYLERKHENDRYQELLKILRVENSTPEPDGSRKEYFIRVPPTTASVQDALAWTFGMNAYQYKPLVET